jgi:alpha-beta hydrolase superfamily lysophospholipase
VANDTRRYAEELVYTSSDDGLLLEGVVVRPHGVAVQPLSFVWIHGNAARFYDYTYVAICRTLASAGYPCAIGNTRGHDIAAFVWRGADGRPRPWRGPQDMPIGGGAAWERLMDAPLDVAAWVQVAAGLAQGGVVLAGHSSGAQRVVLYQAARQDARVTGLALASPDLQGFMGPGELKAAQQLVADGRGLEVVPAQPFAPFYRQSAASIVSRVEVLSRLAASDVATIRCPVLAVHGEREPGAPNVADNPIARQFTASRRVETRSIPEADHFYTGCENQVAGVLADWAATLVSADENTAT